MASCRLRTFPARPALVDVLWDRVGRVNMDCIVDNGSALGHDGVQGVFAGPHFY